MSIQTTGQKARVTQSIIAGQPPRTFVVDVVAVYGEVLRYTTDGVWFTDIRRGYFTDWEIIEPSPEALWQAADDALTERIERLPQEADSEPTPTEIGAAYPGTAHEPMVADMRRTLAATEVVNDLCGDYLRFNYVTRTHSTLVDSDYVTAQSITGIQRDLERLDTIIRNGWEAALLFAPTDSDILMAETVERARMLSAAIRETLRGLFGMAAEPSAR